MALTEIEYGSLASSAVLNGNFNYLDNKIAAVSESLTSNTASIYANIASVNGALTTLQETLSESITSNIGTVNNGVASLMSSNGLYITTYVNGTSWYREYFSNSEKTTRVWLVQGGVTTAWSVTLLKSYSDTNYTVITNSKGSRGSNTDYQIHATPASANSFTLSGQWSTGAYWVTFGK